MSGLRLVVVGATGAVGEEILRVLEERATPVASLVACASSGSVGRRLPFRGGEVDLEPLRAEVFDGCDFALFSAGADLSREWAPRAVARGAVVVDNSSAFRAESDVPLVVPECNAAAAFSHRGIVANPNCSTILLVVVLAPIGAAAGLRRVIVSTYQAASGAGRRAVEEMRDSTAAALAGDRPTPRVLPHSLAFNLFARIDTFGADGYTREEDKMLYETRKILGLPELSVEATCVRVPVARCHAESVTIELERPLTPDAARAILADAPGVVVVDDPAVDRHPQPCFVEREDAVAVGRVRSSRAFPNGLTFWLVGDQLKKGAALNAVQIVEVLSGTRDEPGLRG